MGHKITKRKQIFHVLTKICHLIFFQNKIHWKSCR